MQITPSQPGPVQLNVAGVDRVQNIGPTTAYRFVVKNTAPAVTDANLGAPLGQPRTITFTSKLTGSVAFVYTLNGGPATTVPAADDVPRPSPSHRTRHSTR